MTEKLFYRDSHLKEFTAEVLSCEKRDGHYEVELDRTAFFPEGGGQYADTGVLDEMQVCDVQEKDGRIFHIMKDRSERVSEYFTAGRRVSGRIDWEERFMKMQQHTGEHIVSGLVHARFGYNNVGFHLGSEDCTMDFNGAVTKEELQEIEQEANRAVWKNLPVQVLYPTEEEIASMDYRSKIEIEGQIRIVVIPGYDVCACCAPHVNNTGEIGMIKLTGVQRYKGGVRVTMLCGVRALLDYEEKQKEARSVSAMLCARENEIAEAVEHLQKECADLKQEIGEKEKKLIQYRADMVPDEEKAVCIFGDEFAGESMRHLMNRILEKDRVICAVFSGCERDGYRYVIGSKVMDVRSLAGEFNKVFNGRGGGRPEMVQGTVQGREDEMRKWILQKAGNSSYESNA